MEVATEGGGERERQESINKPTQFQIELERLEREKGRKVVN